MKNLKKGMRGLIAFGVVTLVVAGCGSDRSSGVSYPSGAAATVALSVPSTEPLVSAGETRLVTAVVKDGKGSTIAAPSLSWRTNTPAVATVIGTDAGATITAVEDGTAVITATSGTVEGTVTITVRRRVVEIDLSVPDSVVVAGSTTQLTVVGRDARQQEIRGLTGVTFATSNPFSVLVSPEGLVTALFSPFQPLSSVLTATMTTDGVTLRDTTRIRVGSPAPPVVDFVSLMLPEFVRPEPVLGVGQGVLFLTRSDARIEYKMLWSLLAGSPVSAHIHGPDTDDGVAPVLVELALGGHPTANGVASGSFSETDIRSPDGRPAITLDSLMTLMGTVSSAYIDIHTTLFGDGELRGAIGRIR